MLAALSHVLLIRPPPLLPLPQLKGEEKEQADLDRKAHARMLAAVTFCGALYNVGILTEKIIHTAIDALLKVQCGGVPGRL